MLNSQCTNTIHFPIEQDTVEENRGNFTALNRDNRHKNLKI